jgi:hypothetical protein
MRSSLFLAITVGGALALLSSTATAADFTVTVTTTPSLAYSINGASNPTLNLIRGHTYTFDVQVTGHPFYIKTMQVTGTGSQWTEGVTNPGAPTASGTIETFAVPADAPATLFYQCSIHSVMTGTLSITDPPVVPASGGVTRTLVIGLLGLMGIVAVSRARRALMRALLAT